MTVAAVAGEHDGVVLVHHDGAADEEAAEAHQFTGGALDRDLRADGLAAPELHFFAVAAGPQGVVLLDFEDQVGVGQAQAVAHGGAEHFRVGAALDACHLGVSFLRFR